ncbi:MAG TPA: alkaline phosphatase family protein, partial [Longimicrobiaceae bacterium]|nr:alkaline phosphatase family protein [Longimicrobiaceae bacterium]
MSHRTLRSLPPLALATAVLLAVAGAYACSRGTPDESAGSAEVSAASPCIGAPAPGEWKHVVVLYFENRRYEQVIGSGDAPFITRLAARCGTAYGGGAGAEPTNNWHDADYRVDGTLEDRYNSKPSYATYASGVSPSVHGITNDSYGATSDVDNIYNQLRVAGKTVKSYYDGPASDAPCASANFHGAYHDAIRYFTNVGGQSADPSTFCNTHDVPLSTFAADLESGNLPAYAVILPTNDENMHNNSVASGDAWAEEFLTPLLDSEQYRKGDTAIFFLWDEDTPIPNVLIAPSIVPGSKVPAPAAYPISHFSALRTWDEMLGLPLLADAARAPS